MSSSRDDQTQPLNNALFMMKRLIIMRSAVICDRHIPSASFADQVHDQLFDTMLEKPSKKILKKEQKQIAAHPQILADIDKQRDSIIKKILYDIAHQDLKALEPKHFTKLIQDLCQLETDKQMLAYLEAFANVKDKRGKTAVADYQINFLAAKLSEQSSAIPGGKITDNKAIEYLINLGYKNLIQIDENNQRYVKQADLGNHVIDAIKKSGLIDGGEQAFKVLQILTYTNNIARETANIALSQKKADAVSENASSPAWKAKDKTTLTSIFPVDDETADLKRQAQSLPSSEKEIEQRLKRIERQALMLELEKYEDRSPKAKKRFMDKNADAIMDLYIQLEKQGFHQAKNEFKSYLTNYFIKPVQESILRQADKLIDTLQTAILNDTVDDKLLAKVSRTMTKIIKNLGESAESDTLMTKFAALIVKAHEVNENKAAFRQDVMALADEIMNHIEKLSSPITLASTEVETQQVSSASTSESDRDSVAAIQIDERILDDEAMNNLGSLASDPLDGITSAPLERTSAMGLQTHVNPTHDIHAEKQEALQTGVRLKS